MRSASIRRRMQEKRKKYANCVYVCVRREEREREAVSSKEGERKWQTWPEERKGAFEKDNPWETAHWTRCPVSTLLLLLPPCVLCHGYQTGLPMQPVNVFFSGGSELGTNVSQSVSRTINVNCPGMHKHMEGPRAREHRATLAERQGRSLNEEHVAFIYSPENRRAPALCWEKCDSEEVLFVFSAGAWYHMINTALIRNIYLTLNSCLGEQKCILRCLRASWLRFKKSFSVYIGFTWTSTKQHNKFSQFLEFYCHIFS